MLRFVAAALAAALALPVSPARAAAPSGDCSVALAQVRGSGLTHRGLLFGVALDDTGATVSLRCYVTVNGVTEAEATGSGTAFALAAAPVDVFVRDGDIVRVCTDINGFATCRNATSSTVPPQEVVDLLCTVTRTIGGMGFDILGLIRIEPDGHVYLANARVWYCREAATVYYVLPGL